MCLANKFYQVIPNSEEKERLIKAGLGFKKIKLFLEDDEAEVIRKLTSEEKGEDGLNLAFPHLKMLVDLKS